VEKETLSFTLHPNPADEMVIITFTKTLPVQIELITVLGQILMVEKVNTQEVFLDTTKLSSGTYFVRVKSDDKINLKKLVIN
jgi:hypothetical protein